MQTQQAKAKLLSHLHIKGNPLILFNVWDAGSAQAIQTTGAKAIATSSWSVAATHGYADGEKLPFNLALANLKRIIAQVDLPLTFDLECGYGNSIQEIKENVAKVIEAGAVGINFEDQILGTNDSHSINEQCICIESIRAVANALAVQLFINARTDIFLQCTVESHNEFLVNQALTRGQAYMKAGADGLFVPGLKNIDLIEKLCQKSEMPINIMMMADSPTPKQLAAAGVARISYGAFTYFKMIEFLKDEHAKALKFLS